MFLRSARMAVFVAAVMIGLLQASSYYPVTAAAAAAAAAEASEPTPRGAAKVTSAPAGWLESAVPHLRLDVRGGAERGRQSSSSSSSSKILHLMDPGYADEDLEDYDFYSYEFQRMSRNIDDHEDPQETTTTPSRSFVADVPTTGTCVEDGTCTLPTLDNEEKDSDEAQSELEDSTDEMEETSDEDESSSQEASYVEHASSPGDDRKALLESGAVPKEAPSQEYSGADLAAGADLGVPQIVSDDAVRERILRARTYMHEQVNDLHNNKYDKVRDLCRNKHESCAFWATVGECDANPAYLLINCAPVCESCEQLHIDTRCPMDPTAPNAWEPGDLNAMFERIVTDPTLAAYQPKVLSRPSYAPGDTNETADYKIGLWMVLFDRAVSDDEADRLRELGEIQGYERSSDVGEEQPDGTFTAHVNEKRTSTNSWCTGDCYKDPVAQRVMDRISTITGIPETNSENLQMLRYGPNEFYKTHNDYIPYQKYRQAGVRIATFYIYLNDVEEGGETNFPRNHNLSVKPKKGRAVLWPSVYNDNPHEQDSRSNHQAMPVIRGIKYGANAWIHQRDFKGPNSRGC